MTNARAKLLLRIAGLFNILGGGMLLALPDWAFRLLYGRTLGPADDLLRTHHFLLFGFVVMIGIGIASSAADLRQARGILLSSILGKTLAAVVWLRMVVMQQGTPLLAVAAITDLAWAVLFVIMLRVDATRSAAN